MSHYPEPDDTGLVLAMLAAAVGAVALVTLTLIFVPAVM